MIVKTGRIQKKCVCRIKQQGNLNIQDGVSNQVVTIKGRGNGEHMDKIKGSRHQQKASVCMSAQQLMVGIRR